VRASSIGSKSRGSEDTGGRLSRPVPVTVPGTV
jgi:hypothetical protein